MTTDRLPPLPDEQLTPEQARAAAAVSAGPRGALFGPFVPLMRAPELMDRLQQVGAYLRYESSLPRDAFELAVLMVARAWDQQFEWTHHRPLAAAAGVTEETLEALATGAVPSALPGAQADAHALVLELQRDRAVSDETWAAAVDRFGEPGVVELVVTVGYYTTLAMVMNAAGTPVPEGAGPLLPDRVG